MNHCEEDPRHYSDAEYIQSSIEKWLEVRNLIKERVPGRYFTTFWHACGYCRAFKSCEYCPLSVKSKALGIPFCHSDDEVYSVATYALHEADYALHEADQREWENALRATDLLLAKMRRDLAKAKK